MSVSCMLCVVRYRTLRRADHSSRGVLPSVVCLTECDHESSIMRRTWPSKAVAPCGEGGNLRPTDIYQHLPAVLYTHYIKLCFMQFPWQRTNYHFIPNNILFFCVIIVVPVLSISCYLRVIYSIDNLDTVAKLVEVPRTFTVLAILTLHCV
jgi:hypothetical protein